MTLGRGAAITLCAVAAACAGGCGGASAPRGGGAGPDPSVEPPPANDLRAIARTIRIHGRWLSAGAGAVWLSSPRAIHRLLARVDQRDGQVAERYGPPVGDGAVAVGFGAAWISAPGIDTVWRLPLQRVPRQAPRT